METMVVQENGTTTLFTRPHYSTPGGYVYRGTVTAIEYVETENVVTEEQIVLFDSETQKRLEKQHGRVSQVTVERMSAAKKRKRAPIDVLLSARKATTETRLQQATGAAMTRTKTTTTTKRVGRNNCEESNDIDVAIERLYDTLREKATQAGCDEVADVKLCFLTVIREGRWWTKIVASGVARKRRKLCFEEDVEEEKDVETFIGRPD